MKRTLLIALGLCCLGTAKAQQGTFSVTNDQGSFVVTGVNGSTQTQKYSAITFQFPSTLANATINFADAPGHNVSIFAQDKKLGAGIGAANAGNTLYSINLKQSGTKYVVEGFPSSAVPASFTLKINGTYVGSFQFAAITTPNVNVPNTPATPATPSGPVNPAPPTANGPYKPGHVLYDALYIQEHLNNPAYKDSLQSILLYYDIVNKDSLQLNTYLNGLLGGLYKDKVMVEGIDEMTPASLVNSIGGMDVTNLADGLAQFIVERTKQELNVAFFNDFSKALNEPKYADLRTVFPSTYKTLNVIGEDIYMYNAYIQTLRESFKQDLENLPENLPSILDNHPDFFNKRPELKAMLKHGFYLAEQIKDKQHPGNIIANYPIENLDSVPGNVQPSVKTLQLVSKSLKYNADSTRYWAPESDLKKLFSDDKTLKLYLGLLEQQAQKDKIYFSGKSLKKIIDASFSNYAAYKGHFRTTISKIQYIESKIEAAKNAKGDSLKLESYYGLISTSLQLMEHLATADKLPNFPNEIKVKQEIAKYIYVAQTASDLVIDVNRKNYGSAVINMVALYDTIFTDFNLKQYASITKYKKLDSLLSDAEVTEKMLLKYGSLMANIVLAKTPADVEAAIEAVALPAGSSTIKRQSVFNVSLNAYCGLYGGYERIKGVDPAWMTAKKSFANSYGITAPVGIAISTGKKRGVPVVGAFIPKGHCSHTLFLSIIDIGAVTAFRFTDDSTETVPTIKLQNIVSPGIFYSLGIANSPISINAGWQMGPLLRKVDAAIDENTYSQSYSRVSVSLCVDIPLLNFYTKSDGKYRP